MDTYSMIEALQAHGPLTATSFHWNNMESSDDGATWRKVQEMVAQRVHP